MRAITNEQLAELIKAGDTDAVFLLWTQVERFARMTARRYETAGKRTGAEMGDFMQEAFHAMLEAAAYFDSSKEAKFLTVYGWYLRRRFHKLTGYSRSTKKVNPIYLTRSLSEPITTADGSDTPLEDFLNDPNAVDPEEAALCMSLHDAMRKALDTLPEDQRAAVEDFYYLGISTDTKLRQQGLKALRNPAVSDTLKHFL